MTKAAGRAGQATRPPPPQDPPRRRPAPHPHPRPPLVPPRRPPPPPAPRPLATVLHHRFALPQVALAALFDVRSETINRRIRDTRQLLDQAGHIIAPADQSLTALDDLYALATTAGIAIPTRIRTAS